MRKPKVKLRKPELIAKGKGISIYRQPRVVDGEVFEGGIGVYYSKETEPDLRNNEAQARDDLVKKLRRNR